MNSPTQLLTFPSHTDQPAHGVAGKPEPEPVVAASFRHEAKASVQSQVSQEPQHRRCSWNRDMGSVVVGLTPIDSTRPNRRKHPSLLRRSLILLCPNIELKTVP